MSKTYDLIIIGGGPGGYVAANHASKHGLSVALIEAEHLGGTCLNTGCIPSKTYLKAASIASTLEHADEWGINASKPTISLSFIKQRKDKVLTQLREGIRHLMEQGKVDVYNGLGTIQDHNTHIVNVTTLVGEVFLEGKKIIVATGSKPTIPNIKGMDCSKIYTTDTIFNEENIPEKLVIIGGGVIGVEFATIFSSFGSKVTILEAANRLLLHEDEEAADIVANALLKKGVQILVDARVTEFVEDNDQVKVAYQLNGEQMLDTDAVLVCIGRRPNMSAVQEVPLQKNGPFLQVNAHYETSVPNILAIGDVIGGHQLAHVASAEGIAVIDYIVGKTNTMNVAHIPRCIYTSPEIATVGLTEKQAKEKGIDYRVVKYKHNISGKALVLGETEGFTKLVYDDHFGEIIGVTIVGPHATEMIAESTAVMSLEGTVVELANTIHPHPTLSEGLFEAATEALRKMSNVKGE